MSGPPTPFQLVSGALFQARDSLQADTYQTWRNFLKRLENYRGALDPMADQNANLDILLRSIEHDIENELLVRNNLEHETAGFQFYLQLSRLWVLGSYEFLRTLHVLMKKHDHPSATCMKQTNSKGCGRTTCPCCAIGHIKNETALVRMLLAKNEKAQVVTNPPLPTVMSDKILAEKAAKTPPSSHHLYKGEGQIGGVMAWHVYDARVRRNRVISRLELSERILSSLENVHGP